MVRWLVLGVLLTGCRGFEPALGRWTVDSFAVESDTCALFDDYVAGQVFRLGAPSSEEADVSWQLADDLQTDCTLDSTALSCGVIEAVGGEAEATITTSTQPSGGFESEGAFNGRFDVDVTCEGAACAGAGFSAPCEAGITFTASGPPVAD